MYIYVYVYTYIYIQFLRESISPWDFGFQGDQCPCFTRPSCFFNPSM